MAGGSQMRVGLWARLPACIQLSCFPAVAPGGLPHLHPRQPHLQGEADHGARLLTTVPGGGEGLHVEAARREFG